MPINLLVFFLLTLESFTPVDELKQVLPFGLHALSFTGFTGMGFATTFINCNVFRGANEQLEQLTFARNGPRLGLLRYLCWSSDAEEDNNKPSTVSVATVVSFMLLGFCFDVTYAVLLSNTVMHDGSIYFYWQRIYCLGQWGMSFYLFATILPMMARIRALTEQPSFALAFRHLGLWLALLAIFQFLLPCVAVVVVQTKSNLRPAGAALWLPIIGLLRIAQGWAQVCPYITTRSKAFLLNWECACFLHNISEVGKAITGVQIFPIEEDDYNDYSTDWEKDRLPIVEEKEDEMEEENDELESSRTSDNDFYYSSSEVNPQSDADRSVPMSGASSGLKFKRSADRAPISTAEHAFLDLALLVIIDLYIFIVIWFMFGP